MPPRIEGQLGDALVEGLEDGCVGMDRAGVVRIFNPKAEALLGVRAREVVGRKIWDALPLSDFTRAFIAQIKQSSPAPLEQAMVFPGERLVLVRLQAVRTDQGRNLGAVAVLRDMAGVQKLEKGLDQVLQDVTSQLIVPLTSIKGFVETLLEGPYQNAEITRRFLHVINEETNRLVRVVMSLREAAAPPAPQVRVRPTSLEPLLRSAVEMFRGLAEQKNLRLTLEIPPDLPLVEVDGERLQRAVVNLVDNAVKFTGLRGQGEVRVRAVRGDGQVTVEVSDTGVGIGPGDLPRIFERFYRAREGPAATLGGTGLGLSVAKEIVEANGGRIEVHSQPDQGATFTIALPLTE